ncbi:filamentous hemagglutinin N-terminal domain-containing protein [Dialister succinatiphilus]|uniref:two-partner secretion domain-containing protein n=1 Tax=Dialister succinatiphilus TaxID=487173 RepID=UPI002353044C|nr:filamentous hemagglutinin N-terminal domain-containing protein [Dialister succinatiphilus]
MHNYGHWKKTLALLVMSALSLGASSVDAMPEGGVVRSGSGSVTQNGKEMTIRQDSGRLAMDWTGFSVGKDETVRFQQPGKDALALNRVTGNQQSVIDGSLLSNGHVLLVNPNGVVIGKNASIDVGGLVASTAQMKDNFMKEFGNSTGSFSLGGVSDGKIINEGTIKAEGGLVALHAAKVENSGTISNIGGSAVLAAADTLTLTPDADGKLNFTVDGKTAEASALNKGAITADGGTIVMTADSASDVMSTVVNNSGTLQARTLRKNEKGQILLEGGDKGQVEVSGTLDASGTEDGQSAGNIKVIGEKTIVHDGTNLLAKGNVDGGKIETSGDVLNLGDNLNIDAKGINGKAGEWLLDPLEILIQDDKPTQRSMDQTVGTVNEGSGTQITYNDPPSATQNADSTYDSTSWIKTNLITDILNKGTDVTIQAASTSQAASITVNSAINPTVAGDGEATLALEAQRNITINKEIKASGGKLNVKLNSDTDGDGVGAVIINADISTNGGTFTSGSGGNVKFTAPSGTEAGAYAATGIEKDTKPNIAGHTVGTYFGYVVPEGKSAIDLSGEQNNRKIATNGGAITLDGEVAIGLNGGVLTLDTRDTSKKDGTAGGNVNITGIINSGNSYDTYIFGTEKWNKLVENLVKDYLTHNTVPSYRFVGINYTKNKDGTYSYTTQAKHFDKGESHYAFHELNPKDVNGANWTYTNSDATLDTQHTRWYATTKAGDGYNSFIMEGTTPETSQMSIDDWLIYYRRTEPDNYAKKYANGNKDTNSNLVTYEKIQNDPTKMATLESDIRALIAHNWFASESLANPGDKSGANHGDSYLATITTALENSLSTPNSQKTLWVGGMGSGVRNKTNDKTTNPYSQYPADPSHQDGFYWVTGPEGLVTTTVTNADGTTTTIKGTKFWDTSKSYWNKDLKKSNYGEQVYGYTKWSSWSGGGQPDNSAPFLTVGYGNNNAWDDAAIDGGTTVGFVQETNLYNSSLNIKTDGGKVTLQGDLGKSVGLDTVKIDAGSGSVTTGNTKNTATKYNNGTIYADHGVYINGGEVTVGGEIHSGGTDVEATRNTDSSFSDYLDNVTINSAGDIEVHGITSNTYNVANDGTTTTRGGKISLTSTGDSGKITLGAGVDYDGNATAGTIAAGSSDNGAVIIDAQGKTGAFINSTNPKSPAITTAPHGTWQVYVASPSDYGTVLGGNLNSETNAQWSSESTKKSTSAESDKNAAGRDIGTYTDQTHNKFIFQVTPTITVSGQDMTKTYGDTLSDEDLRNKLTITSATFKASDDTSAHSVDDYSKNFQEASDKSAYIASTTDATDTGLKNISVYSGAQDDAATRMDGYKDPTGGTIKSTYHFNVGKENATGLNGYDLATENADIEILRKTVTISTDGTQTYGNTAVTNGTPSYDKTQLVNGDTLGDIQYTIATDGSYADSKGSNDTAHVGSYENQYLTTGAKVKASDGSDASANYAVTGSGTITVNPADLYLTVGNVSTTYGTAFDDTQYGYTVDDAKGGLVNGDTKDAVLGDKFLNYTNTGAKTDASNDKVKTQNAGSYELQGIASKNLSDYTVHITNGKSTVEKAKLTLTVGNTETTYGTAFDPNTYSYTLSGNTNGDTAEDVEHNKITVVTYTNGGEKSDAANDKVKTQNVGDYNLTGTFTLSGDTAANYEIGTVKAGKAEVTPAEIHLKLNDVSTTYGTAFDTSKYGYDVSKLAMANGDNTDVVTKVIANGDITYTNTGDATDPDNENVKTQNAGTGYKLTGTTEKTLQNYKVFIDGADATVDKADLTLTLKDVSTTYGNEFDGSTYGYKKDAADLQGLTNGDAATAITDVLQDSDFTYVNGGAKSDPNNENVKTQNAGSYQITGSTTRTLDNYNIKVVNPGTSTVEKAKLTLTVGDVSTVYGTGFDRTKYTYTISGNANGDTDETLKNNQISVNYTNTGEKADANNDKVKTQDVGDWKLIGNFTVAGDTANNYDVTYVDGTSTVTPAEIHLKLNDVSTTYGTAFTDTNTYGYDVSKLAMANGDSTDVVTKAIGNGDITYTNTGDATDPDKIAKGAKTQDAGTGYQLTGTTERTLKNYKVFIDGADATINKATLKLKVGDYTEAYGAADKVGADLKQTEVTGEQNGDDLADLVSEIGIHNTSGALLSDTRTNDVKYKTDGSLDSYRIDTQLDKDTLKNYNLELSEGTMTLTPVAITVDNEMIQTYGSADRSFKEIATPLLVNGDTISTDGLTMTPKAGGAYETNQAGRTTADAGKYENDLESDGGGIVHENGSDARKNYSVTIKGDIIVNPKDIYTEVNGKGSTLKDLTWEIVRDPKDQMVNGDSVEFTYTPGNLISYDNQTFDVNSFINGTQIYDSTTDVPRYGKNYIFHSKGIVQLTFNPIVKPDVWAHSGGYRPRNKIETSLPVFRVEDAKVGQYGTYGVEHDEEGDRLVLSATGMRLPEPDQVPDEERTFTTTLSTETGSGTFKLVYNGVSLKVYPQDKEAEETVRAGDKNKNVSLSEKALYVGYTEMGLDLIDLKGVYIYFN